MTVGAQGPYAADLELALRLADAADALTLRPVPRRRPRRRDQARPDPGSDADRGVERLCRERLATQPPADGVLGEEWAATGRRRPAGGAGSLDPIDGTKNFVRGVPVWATLLGLVDGDRHRRRRGVGAGAGPPLVGRPRRRAPGRRRRPVGDARAGCRVSAVGALADASLSYSDRSGWPDGGAGVRRARRPCWRTRAYGDFWSHLLVAEGAVDVAASPSCPLGRRGAGRRWSRRPAAGSPGCDGGRRLGRRGRAHHATGCCTTTCSRCSASASAGRRRRPRRQPRTRPGQRSEQRGRGSTAARSNQP